MFDNFGDAPKREFHHKGTECTKGRKASIRFWRATLWEPRTPNPFLALNLLSNAIMICFHRPESLLSLMPERTQKPPTPVPWEPKQGGGDGPRSPDVSKPDTKDLLKRMRKVDPNQSKRYRQRTGQ